MRLSEPIKSIGEFEVPVRLHSEITGSFRVVVKAEDEEVAKAEEAAPAQNAAPAE